MTQKNTGFDAFFQAVTSSPEFKSVATKDWKSQLDKNLQEMDNHIEKATGMF
jgi:hypothetical protein